MAGLNRTHDPKARSWVETANEAACEFPIQNLPYGIFSAGSQPCAGVAIGDQILNLSLLEAEGFVRPSPNEPVFSGDTLNNFMALGQGAWSRTRDRIFELLSAGSGGLCDNADLTGRALVAMSQARLHLPIFVRSYTDFYASLEHATNVGTMFRGADNALPPNWLHIPIGYNGRASSVVVSGTDIHRPWGQLKGPDDEVPRFAPSERFDIELELGAIVGSPSSFGQPVTVEQAYDMIFGYVLLNDWSARDIQAWEYQPLGPFQAKATATTISPWIVTAEALVPFRVSAPERKLRLLTYLTESMPNNFDIDLEIQLIPDNVRASTISRTNYRTMYYSCAQQLAHHTTSGCPMCTGDLLGSGTISGATRDSLGSLLELSCGGKEPIELDNGQTRSFVEDGDTIVLRGHCQGQGYRVGFGKCSGTVMPAVNYPG
ncbi:MAG: fumarylacetoacetase [Hyphomicrobiaceae bacterium]